MQIVNIIEGGSVQSHDDLEWVSEWAAHGALDLPERHVALHDTKWVTWSSIGLQGRELALSNLSDGMLSAQHIKATSTEAEQGAWHCYDLDFEFIYVLDSKLTLETGRCVHVLRPGGSFNHPRFFWHHDLYPSADLDVVRLTSSAPEERFNGLCATLPARAKRLRPAYTGMYTDALAFAMEEHQAECLLKGPNLSADCALGEVQLGRCCGQALTSGCSFGSVKQRSWWKKSPRKGHVILLWNEVD